MDFLKEQKEEFQDLLKANELLYFFHEYRRIIINNIATTSQYNEIIYNLLSLLQYISFLKEKESLLRELELSIQSKKSSDIAATKDLLNKLNESLANNENKLKLFEEDYFQRKSQINEIKITLDNYNNKIQQLTNQKKQCFNQINRITREMGGDKHESKQVIKIDIIESEGDLSNAEKIRAIQKKAKEIQFEINEITTKKKETQIKLDGLTPLYKIIEKDHQSLLEIINNDKKRIKELQSELKNKFKDEKNTEIKDIDIFDLKILRSSKEIKNSIDKTEIELNKYSLPNTYFNPQDPFDLSLIIKKLMKIDEEIIHNKSEMFITINEKEISQSFKQFEELENSLSNIEFFMNKFLTEVNIKSQIRITLTEDQKGFYISIIFIRKDKEQIIFEELTTPEKIFFIIVFYISIKLHINENNIIFSNVSILKQYNKAGSIYRTIRKIIPIFEMEPTLSKFNITFIISNLELKEAIKKLKVITVKES
ncbi:MAG: hypothetical protein ACFFA4_05195 [Promethearchaeota archaeon]